MNLETATNKLVNHPEIKGLLLGIIADDGEFRIDCAAFVNEKDFNKEKEKFIKYRKFILKEKNDSL